MSAVEESDACASGLPPEQSDFQPSKADLTTQNQLVQAANIVGIRVLDHIIVSRKGYFSFQEAGINEIQPQTDES
ncbi:MAG TPA: JAB domain-containing protein [Pyrinomonadaceae bacterium]|nr:JAB domain-containing protein [Pyrinomonadaceae bacterium]